MPKCDLKGKLHRLFPSGYSAMIGNGRAQRIDPAQRALKQSIRKRQMASGSNRRHPIAHRHAPGMLRPTARSIVGEREIYFAGRTVRSPTRFVKPPIFSPRTEPTRPIPAYRATGDVRLRMNPHVPDFLRGIPGDIGLVWAREE